MNKHNCNFPDCRASIAGTFALVPLCATHLDEVWTETRKYYANRPSIRYELSRAAYVQIMHLIPWSKQS